MSNQHLAATRAQDSAGVAVVPADNSEVHFGLTKREYFAAMALSGWLASYGPDATAASTLASNLARENVGDLCVRAADALIAALNKQETP